VTKFIASNEREWFSNQPVNFQMQRPLEANLVALKTLAQAFVEFGVVRLPQFVACFDAPIIYVAIAEAQPRFCATRCDLINASSFLVLIGRACIEHHAIARFEGADEFKRDRLVCDAGDLAEKHTAFLAEAGVNQFLVIVSAEPTCEQATREGHLHVVARSAEWGDLNSD